jgi:hypothetical protein
MNNPGLEATRKHIGEMWEEKKSGLVFEEPKATETVLTDQCACGIVKYVDEHIFIRVTGEKA